MDHANGPDVASSKAKILIVEDNSDVRRLYAIGLNRFGFEVRLAANGAEALTRIEEERPDLMLLDVVMPIMDGWEVLARVNPPETRDPIPTVVVTGHPLPEDHELPTSVVGWLNKPISIEELIATISQKLDARRSSLATSR